MAVLLGAALAAAALGREPTFEEYREIQDSLHSMPMRMQSRWLAERDIELPEWNDAQPAIPESGGLRMVGKWGRGPAVEVTGRDSLLFLSLGSEVAIINIANPDSPRVVSEVQAQGLVVNAAVKDSFLYIGCRLGTVGIEVWNISNLTDPVFRGRAVTRLSDFCVQDSFAYVTLRVSDTSNDTFKVYNMSDPTNPRLVGWIPDHGDKIAVSGNRAAIADWGDMHIMDITDPAHPQRMGSVGMDALGIDIRGNLVCAVKWWNGKSDDFWFAAFDITDPWSPRRLSEIHGVGGYDVHLSGPLAFISGFYYDWELAIVDISDSTQMSLISTCNTPGWNEGVWSDWTSNQAYVADHDRGLTVIDISNLNNPVLDRTLFLAAGLAVDVSLCDTLMYVATWSGGMQIVNVADPSRPVTVAQYDSTGYHSWETTVLASDSFVFVGDFHLRPFRVLDVTDPSNPQLAGYMQQGSFNPAEEMVLCDSFVYCAEVYRFQVVNVARPREPVLVGTLSTQDGVYFGLAVQDSFAYLISGMVEIINVAQPANPTIVSRTASFGSGIAVRDTFAYVPYGYDTLRVFSAAYPKQLRLLGIAPLQTHTWDVALAESIAAVATFNGLEVFSLENPAQPHWRAAISTPYGPRRVVYAAPYFYTAMWDAGAGIYSAESVGVQEPAVQTGHRQTSAPTIVRGVLFLPTASGLKPQAASWLLDVSGRKVLALHPGANDVRALAPGVYFVREALGVKRDASDVTKVIITQ